jgi:hypothetical protein
MVFVMTPDGKCGAPAWASPNVNKAGFADLAAVHADIDMDAG